MTPAEQELRLEELQIELERERKHSRDLLASYRDLKDSTGCIYHDEAATWIKSKKTETVGGYAALLDATGQNSHVNAVKWIRDAMSNIKSLTSKCSQLTDELEGLKNAVDFWRASRDDWQDKWQQLVDAIGPVTTHTDALNWIKMAASVIPGCVDSTKEKIATLAENEELKRKVAELKAKVDNQQEELLDCRATVNSTQDSRDYWRGACSKLTRAIGIDAIDDAVEWIRGAKSIEKRVIELKDENAGLISSVDKIVGSANFSHDCWLELARATGVECVCQSAALEWIKNASWQISDLSKQLMLAKEGLSLRDKRNMDLCQKITELEVKVMNQAKDLASARFDISAKTIHQNHIDWRGNSLILATGTYSYDHALAWIKRHRSNDEVNSLIGDKV